MAIRCLKSIIPLQNLKYIFHSIKIPNPIYNTEKISIVSSIIFSSQKKMSTKYNTQNLYPSSHSCYQLIEKNFLMSLFAIKLLLISLSTLSLLFHIKCVSINAQMYSMSCSCYYLEMNSTKKKILYYKLQVVSSCPFYAAADDVQWINV